MRAYGHEHAGQMKRMQSKKLEWGILIYADQIISVEVIANDL